MNEIDTIQLTEDFIFSALVDCLILSYQRTWVSCYCISRERHSMKTSNFLHIYLFVFGNNLVAIIILAQATIMLAPDSCLISPIADPYGSDI